MRTLVSLDTETGIIRRYTGNAGMTHEAGLTCDPNDPVKTATILEGFRLNPHQDFRVVKRWPRTYEDAVAEQRAHREQLLLAAPLSHRDEA